MKALLHLIPRIAGLLVLLLIVDCRRAVDREVVVYTSVDQPFSEPVFKDFEKTTGVRVRAVYQDPKPGSAELVDTLLTGAASSKPDVVWSGDPVRALQLVQRGMVQPYASERAQQIPAAWRAIEGSWTALAARAGVLLVNRNKVPSARMPSSIRDLADPQWKQQTAIASPLHGTTAMLASSWFSQWGDDRAQAFLRELKDNGVRVVDSGEEVARLVVTGEIAFGLVDTDDAHEAMHESAHVAVVYPDQQGEGALLMPTTVVAMRGGAHPDTARQLIDYLLSSEVESHMAEQAARIPLRAGIAAPPSIRPLAQIRAMKVDYARLAADMGRVQPILRAWAGPS